MLLKKPIVVLVVLEFYSNLKITTRNRVYVKHANVEISPTAICEYYGVSFYDEDELSSINLNCFTNLDMDAILNYLTEGRGEWKCDASKGQHLSFKQTIMFLVAKIWM